MNIGIIGYGIVGKAVDLTISRVHSVFKYDKYQSLNDFEELKDCEIIFISVPTPFDCDKNKVDDSAIKESLSSRTRGIVLVNLYGKLANIDEIASFTKKKDLFLIEDCAQSVGSKYKNKFLGSYGTFGSFSFYYSHQITSGEGGMIVCNLSLIHI